MKTKSKEERVKEVLNIRKQLKELELDTLDEVTVLFPYMRDFVESGQSFTKKVKIEILNRNLHIQLSNQLNRECVVVLRQIK